MTVYFALQESTVLLKETVNQVVNVPLVIIVQLEQSFPTNILAQHQPFFLMLQLKTLHHVLLVFLDIIVQSLD